MYLRMYKNEYLNKNYEIKFIRIIIRFERWFDNVWLNGKVAKFTIYRLSTKRLGSICLSIIKEINFVDEWFRNKNKITKWLVFWFIITKMCLVVWFIQSIIFLTCCFIKYCKIIKITIRFHGIVSWNIKERISWYDSSITWWCSYLWFIHGWCKMG